MSTGSAHLYHTTHPSSAGKVQHCFPTKGDTQASAKEAGNKPIISATLPLHCLTTWVYTPCPQKEASPFHHLNT